MQVNILTQMHQYFRDKKHCHMHCSDPLPHVSIKQDEKKAVLCRGAMENSSFSGQRNSMGP